jgi:hypothetical protein
MARRRVGGGWLAIFLLIAGRAHAADWKVEVVDRTGTGLYSSLKVDKTGNAHLAYVIDDGRRYPLKYAFRDHALDKWFVMEVASGAAYSSLALDSKGRPHISYVDAERKSGAKLHYAHWDGTAWKSEVIPLNADIIGYYTSIVFNSEDHPSISFCEYAGPRGTGLKMRLRNVTWTGEYWTAQTVDAQEGSGAFNAMAVDGRGTLHLAYVTSGAGEGSTRYAFWNGKWNLEFIEASEQRDGESIGAACALTVDKDGNPYAAYVSSTNGVVKFAARHAGLWEIQAVDRISRWVDGDRNSIVVDADGTPYIAYNDGANGKLKLAHRQGKEWVRETVDDHLSGFTSSLQIQDGTLWISYADAGSRSMKVARAEIPRSEAPASSQKEDSAPPPTKAGKR